MQHLVVERDGEEAGRVPLEDLGVLIVSDRSRCATPSSCANV